MPSYWLDADVLIRAKNEYYAFEFGETFWQFLEQKGAEGIVASCRAVYDELQKKEDELKAWATQQQGNGFFWEPDEQVQATYGRIGDYVAANYRPEFSAPFLAGADAWVIAQATVHGGAVVTIEKPAPDSHRPKIPDIARRFDVQTADPFAVLRTLGFHF